MCWDLGQLFLIRLLKKNSATAENVAQTIETKVNRNLEISKLEGWKDAIKELTVKKFIEISCQTNSHSEIPYQVTSPFLHVWKRDVLEILIIPLDLIPCQTWTCWYKPEYDHTDDAEEALGEQYDKSGNNST